MTYLYNYDNIPFENVKTFLTYQPIYERRYFMWNGDLFREEQEKEQQTLQMSKASEYYRKIGLRDRASEIDARRERIEDEQTFR